MELQGRTAIVTEPGEVSARAPQWCFLVNGAHVVMYRNLEDAQSVAQWIVLSGGMAIAFEAEANKKSAFDDLAAETDKQYGTLAFW